MGSSEQKQQVTLCGKRLTGLRHICAFFDSEILAPYLKEGIAEVLATHSHLLLGGQIHENPHSMRKIALRRRDSSLRV